MPQNVSMAASASRWLALLALGLLPACGSGSNAQSSGAAGAGDAVSARPALVSSASVDPEASTELAAVYTPGSSGARAVIVPPSGYGTIQTIAAPGDAAGAWAWSASATDSRVWHVDGAGKSGSWSLGSDAEVRAPASQPAMAACGDQAWLGVNHTLIHLDSASGVVARFRLPETSPIAAVDAYRPPSLQGVAAIDAVACDGTHVAVAVSDATTGLVFDPGTKQFTTVALPDGYEAVSVALAANGRVAFGARGYGPVALPPQVLVAGFDGRHALVSSVQDASSLSVDGGRLRVGQVGQGVDLATGAVTGATVPTWVTDARDPLHDRAPVEGVGGSWLAREARTGRLVVTSGGAAPRSSSVDLGRGAVCAQHPAW